MIKFNERMRNILKKLEETGSKDTIEIDSLANIIHPNFKKVYNCIIIDLEDTIKEENINFQRILSMFGDRTGYEASCNEIRINDYIDELDELTIIQIGKIIMSAWKDKLSEQYPEYNFSIILSFNKGQCTIRFHMIREDEDRWLDGELNNYNDEAIIVEEI